MKRLAAFCVLVSMFAILTLFAIPQVAQATPNVLILADNSGVPVNGGSHVADLIAAFQSTGAAVTTNSAELTNGLAMPLSLVTGKDVVIIVTVSGSQIDAVDIPVLQTAVSTHASGAFLFFTDACVGCARGSASAVLPILNAAGGWSATLGAGDNSGYLGYLAGVYNTPFLGWPTINGTAYSPLLGVPSANVIYWTNAPHSPGASAVVAPGTPTSSCVFMATDVTPFWVTGGIPVAQANGLAAAYLNAAMGCPLQPGPIDFLNVTTVNAGTVTRTPDLAYYPPGTSVQLTASPALVFEGWSGDASGTANPLTVTMNADKNITATFSSEYILNVTTIGDGSVTKTPDQPTYLPGTIVQLTATPDPPLIFVGWSGNLSGGSNPVNVTMNTHKNITATFAPAGGRDCHCPKITLAPTWQSPALTTLEQNYPNPFNPQTTIAFSIKERGNVGLNIYSAAGRLVRTLANESLAAGPHTKEWDGRDNNGKPVSSGVYFYKLVTKNFSQTKKLVLLK